MSHFLEEVGLSKPDGPVYHYTSAEAAKSILTTGRLRASRSSELNDLGEVQFGWERVGAWLSSGAKSAGGTIRNFIQNAYDDATATDAFLRESQYVVSASLHGDSATQWLAYGGTGAGVALELSTERPLRPVSPDDECVRASHHQLDPLFRCRSSASTTPWFGVVYNDDRQLTLVSRFHDHFQHLWSNAPTPDDEDDYLAHHQEFEAEVRADLWTLVAFFKHSSFADENEARTVIETHSSLFDHYDVQDGAFKQFIELTGPDHAVSCQHAGVAHGAADARSSPLPMTGVTIGPRHRASSLAASAIQHFARQGGASELSTRLSGTPLR